MNSPNSQKSIYHYNIFINWKLFGQYNPCSIMKYLMSTVLIRNKMSESLLICSKKNNLQYLELQSWTTSHQWQYLYNVLLSQIKLTFHGLKYRMKNTVVIDKQILIWATIYINKTFVIIISEINKSNNWYKYDSNKMIFSKNYKMYK